MFSRSAFGSGRAPSVPEAFSEADLAFGGAIARGKQKEDQEEDSPPLPNPAISLDRETSRYESPPKPEPLENETEAATSSQAQTGGISAGEKPYLDMAPDLMREQLCIKAAGMVWDDLSQVLIWPMNDIAHNDDAMIQRVKDLLGPDISDEEVILGKPFVANHINSMAIVEDESLCGILVTTENKKGQIRVADLQNLKKQTERYAVGYGEWNIASKRFSGHHVMIVKRGQNAVIEGRPTLRFFLRVRPGMTKLAAGLVAEDPWTLRRTVHKPEFCVWHEYFTGRP